MVVPGNLLHHGLLEIDRLDALVFDEVLDLTERHDTVRVSAFTLLARTYEGAPEAVTALVSDGVAAAIHSKTEVNLLRIKSIEPERNGVVANLTNISLATDDLSKSSNILIPETVKIYYRVSVSKRKSREY